MLYVPQRPLPRLIQPCLPTTAARPPAGFDWIHEIKHAANLGNIQQLRKKKGPAEKRGL
jgi:hypothetical protein